MTSGNDGPDRSAPSAEPTVDSDSSIRPYSGSSSGDAVSEANNPPPKLKAGDRIGGCVVTRFMAWGGMGEVYEGRHETLDRRVAIKLIRDKYAREPRYRSRFLREAKATAQFTDPHIAIVFDAGEQGDQLYAVLEYIEGEDVSARLKRLGILPPEDALRITRDAAKGLAVAHQKKLIHRDVKPSNIMVTPNGAAKLMDFGLVRVMSGEGLEKTDTGAVVGTPQYMSLEQWNGQSPDERADLYALGVTLYEMLCGKRPTTGSSLGEICTQVSTRQLVPLRQRHPGLDPAIHALVEWLLAPIEERCPSALELTERIESMLQRGVAPPASAPDQDRTTTLDIPLSAAPSSDSIERPPSQAQTFAMYVAAGILLAAVVALAFRGSQGNSNDRASAQRSLSKGGQTPTGVDTAEKKGIPRLVKEAEILAPLKVNWVVIGQRKVGKGVDGEDAYEEVDLHKYRSLASGDQFQFRITPEQDCHLYVLWMTSQGEPLLLYPPATRVEASSVKANSEIVLPGEELFYKLDNFTGQERFYVAACYEAVESVARMLRRIEGLHRGAEEEEVEMPFKEVEWLEALDEIAKAPTPAGTRIDTTRGLAGITTSKRVRVKLPSGKETQGLCREIIGSAGLLHRLEVTHK